MPPSLRNYVIGVVTLSACVLAVATLMFPATDGIALGPSKILDPTAPAATQTQIWLGIAFWIVATLVTSALPVKLPMGTHQAVAMAPIIAAMALGGPAAAGWVAAIGTTEVRELRGRIPWYGSLVNHAGATLPAVLGGVVYVWIVDSLSPGRGDLGVDLVATAAGSAVFIGLNTAIAGGVLALRTGVTLRSVIGGDYRATAFNNLALAPIAWLMALVYSVSWWATLLFALPLYTTRMASVRFVEMRDMFTQTIGALASAVDKRDPYTARHSENVKTISVDIGKVMRVNDTELEALEWGGLLHDVGKIGVPDHVLLKKAKLNREERMIMNSHPVLGAQIIQPVAKLARELPIIRHHHEWYNGSGYPDRLIGDEIPKLARILHVADAFEAMTAARPYRMTPLTPEQALAELRKFAGVQFDPVVVDAFVKTRHVDGVADPGRSVVPRQIPLISQAADQISMSQRESRPGSSAPGSAAPGSTTSPGSQMAAGSPADRA
jgi:putative nucleotidyltransferase with HDIG domain